MSAAAPVAATEELLFEGLELTRTVRECVEQGRLDLLEDTLARREACLRLVRDTLRDTTSAPELLERLRAEDRALREWMEQEKQEVLRALTALRGHRVDPYAEPLLSGPTALDQRR